MSRPVRPRANARFARALQLIAALGYVVALIESVASMRGPVSHRVVLLVGSVALCVVSAVLLARARREGRR